MTIREYTEKYIEAFLEDMRSLNLEMPEELVRATDHIDDMVALIERLTKKGFTYPSDGSIYYRIAKFPDYGKLSKIDVSGMKAGARADTDRYEKDDVRDFALWKAPKPGEFFWETPIGPGRPGWHIECAAMSMKYLGETLDIHTGGIDLAFPHHENEIAESEAATGRTFAKMWLHAEHLIIEGEKMSKSLGNFYTLRDLFAKGYKPSSIRFLLLSVPYNRQLNFTMDGLRQAESSVERMRNFVARLKSEKFADGENSEIHERATKAEKDFDLALADDLNTAVALAAVFDLVRDINTAMDQGVVLAQDATRLVASMEKFDQILSVLVDDDADRLARLGFGSGKTRAARRRNRSAHRSSARPRRSAAISNAPMKFANNSQTLVSLSKT